MSRHGPPAAWMTFSLKGVKKPIDRLSGDQNGNAAISVPARSFASSESRSRTHSIIRPLTSAQNAILRPSGEMTKESNAALSGGRSESRRTLGICGCAGGWRSENSGT